LAMAIGLKSRDLAEGPEELIYDKYSLVRG
jgi:hypothetical protein